MHSGVCVKCEASEIYGLPCTASGKYQDLWLGGQTIFAAKSSYFLVCGECGFAERYVDPEFIGKLAKYGERIL